MYWYVKSHSWDGSSSLTHVCAVGEETLEPGQCLLVKGDNTNDTDVIEGETEDGTLSAWKAQLHQIRALNTNHVYLLVAWLYRPQHDLPASVRASYHAKHELIPSTEVCISDAMSVYGSVPVRHWDEHDDDDVPEADEYFWRQAYDHIAGTLSEVRRVCVCEQPHNPDHPILQCRHCEGWMHARCLEQDALRRVLAGTTEGETAKEEAGGKGAEFSAINESKPAVTMGEDEKEKKTKKASKIKAKGRGKRKRKSEVEDAHEADPGLEKTGVGDTASISISAELRVTEANEHSGGSKSRIVVTGEEEREVECLFCHKGIDD